MLYHLCSVHHIPFRCHLHGVCGGFLSEGGWLICLRRFEEEHSCFWLCGLLVLVAPGVRCGFVLLCVRLCTCILRCYIINGFGRGLWLWWVLGKQIFFQRTKTALRFTEFQGVCCMFLQHFDIFLYIHTSFRQVPPPQLVSPNADFTITHVLPSQPPGTFPCASFRV